MAGSLARVGVVGPTRASVDSTPRTGMPARQGFVVLDERTEVGADGAEVEVGAPGALNQ
jgi:hypothetical protein